jgi:hypothetical protein
MIEKNGRRQCSPQPLAHIISKAGYHTLKIWMVDPGVVLEKSWSIAGCQPGYLGPPESFTAMS